MGRGRVKKGQATVKGAATSGMVLGVISVLLWITGLVLTLWVFNKASDEIERQTGNNVSEELHAGDLAK
ncbi:hypothetical protein [Streptomyces sp. NPDC057375]|uniref:hypothetical protein n=1 Tax=Streptomyces sp. NPDC057375 TaxID=3346109 RepID=UPI00364264F9